ncbi:MULTISPECIES: hypothetical protein [unclassified Sphingomonas]|uniref:hypothetical protein n=1 Tax=unclassified Sphingomonas TaxID=196159 RepID=UPI000831C630|nr:MULTISPECIES: hypothetical protein [unclassified Sphingomonas]
MLTFLVSLFTLFAAPTGLVTVPPPVAADAAATNRHLDWLGGTWRGNGLEMKCDQTKLGITCNEEGVSGAMHGAKAELEFETAGEKALLRLTLPSIPSSAFTEVARDGQSVTFEMPVKGGTARLRFSRTGDVLKVERGTAQGWGNAMEYRRG